MLSSSRRACLATLLAAPLLASRPAHAAADDRFRLFEAMRFDGRPDMASCGLVRIPILYSYAMWPTRDWSEPDLDYLESNGIPSLNDPSPERLVLDIEHWEDIGDIDKLIAIVGRVRELLPATRIGFYGQVPMQEYRVFQRGMERNVRQFRLQTDAWRPLIDLIDDLYPSLYTHYDDPAGWQRMAEGQIELSLSYGKPTYPFVWPQYHETNPDLKYQLIGAEFWRLQLETIRSAGSAGAVLWGTLGGDRIDGKIPRLTWDPHAGWWQETVAFAKKYGIATPACA